MEAYLFRPVEDTRIPEILKFLMGYYTDFFELILITENTIIDPSTFNFAVEHDIYTKEMDFGKFSEILLEEVEENDNLLNELNSYLEKPVTLKRLYNLIADKRFVIFSDDEILKRDGIYQIAKTLQIDSVKELINYGAKPEIVINEDYADYEDKFRDYILRYVIFFTKKSSEFHARPGDILMMEIPLDDFVY